MRGRVRDWCRLWPMAPLLACFDVAAMMPLEDEQMAVISGTGLAFVLGDGVDPFRFQMAPTSYIEAVGEHPNPTGAASGTTMNRSDLRWYGLSMSSATGAGATWAGAACSGGLNSMGCPMTTSGITNFANHDNPYVLRVFDYSRVGRNSGSSDWVQGVERTVLELVGPSNTDTFLWSFWGETKATDATGTQLGYTLQSQSIIRGKPAARAKPPSIFGTSDAANPMAGPLLRMFQNQTDESLGLSFDSRLSGDYRFTVNQSGSAASWQGVPVPEFTVEEGLYFTNVNAFLPLGQLHYQSLVLNDSVDNDGNFTIELTRLPNDVDAYGDAYQIAGQNGYQRTGRSDRYYQTHGYVEWGAGFPTCPPGTTNCLPGTGVSSQRFSGSGYTAGTESITLPALAVNETNFPGLLCRNSREDECLLYRGTAGAVTVPLSSASISQTGTRQQIVAAGGISFVSRSGGSWMVQNRQTTGDVVKTLEKNRDVMIWRTSVDDDAAFGGVCGFLINCRLNGETPSPASAPDVLRNLSPMVSVNAINLGASRVEGLMFHHMKMTTLSAGGN